MERTSAVICVWLKDRCTRPDLSIDCDDGEVANFSRSVHERMGWEQVETWALSLHSSD